LGMIATSDIDTLHVTSFEFRVSSFEFQVSKRNSNQEGKRNYSSRRSNPESRTGNPKPEPRNSNWELETRNSEHETFWRLNELPKQVIRLSTDYTTQGESKTCRRAVIAKSIRPKNVRRARIPPAARARQPARTAT